MTALLAAPRRAPVRLAMWSGPRNISTAMMRAWENRADTIVVDEPFYAHYLDATGAEHPMRAEIVAAGETDPERVIDSLLAPLPDGVAVFYQKHMTHHLLADVPVEWIGAVANAFLIRDPAEVVASYAVQRPGAPITADDIGIVRQVQIFEYVREHTGRVPPVLDAADVLRDPERMLGRLCAELGIAFSPAMLSWPPGRRASDGVWAAHWYASVERSTGFAPSRPPAAPLDPALRPLAEAQRSYYERLYEARLD